MYCSDRVHVLAEVEYTKTIELVTMAEDGLEDRVLDRSTLSWSGTQSFKDYTQRGGVKAYREVDARSLEDLPGLVHEYRNIKVCTCTIEQQEATVSCQPTEFAFGWSVIDTVCATPPYIEPVCPGLGLHGPWAA